MLARNYGCENIRNFLKIRKNPIKSATKYYDQILEIRTKFISQFLNINSDIVS